MKPLISPSILKGTTGELAWSFADGTLTLSGSGAIPNYDHEESPWNDFRGKITAIRVGNGVTRIGENAFAGCNNLTSIALPHSLKGLGAWAFAGCSSLPAMTLPNSVKGIGRRAFSGCRSLTSIALPDSVTGIGGGAFAYCSNLTDIDLPNSVIEIGGGVFWALPPIDLCDSAQPRDKDRGKGFCLLQQPHGRHHPQ
jgi:hypothetical protein